VHQGQAFGRREYLKRFWIEDCATKPILDKLNAALDNALDDENTRKRLQDSGGEIPDNARRGPRALAALVKSEIARWTPIIKAANVSVE
jgi:tripartite-type tricarboxylate transporter receptor subunit TctC